MEKTNPIPSNAFYGSNLRALIPQFLTYGRFECGFTDQTLKKYGSCLNRVVKDIGDISVEQLDLACISLVKQKIYERGAGASWIATTTYVIKHFLKFCNGLGFKTIDVNLITTPKRPKREVIYLTANEIEEFVNSIKMETQERSIHGDYLNHQAVRFRCLVEVLLGTAMRISEALSLDVTHVNTIITDKELKIIGKGNKERTVFFNDRAIQWINYYMGVRKDDFQPLFPTGDGRRLARADVSRIFQGYVKKARLSKKITPHILRHTAATILLLNGCPIGLIKEILGHAKLETTCKYYLGILDKVHAKEAHEKYLNF